MLPRHPYMLRALYEWLVDSGDVPHLLVNVDFDGVKVPVDYVRDGRIVLNVGPDAVENLSLGNEFIMFSARFGGRPREIVLPQESVIAIYGRNSGEGMMFHLDEAELPDSTGFDAYGHEDDMADRQPTLESVEDTGEDIESGDTEDSNGSRHDDGDNEGPGGKRKRGKPNLKIIK